MIKKEVEKQVEISTNILNSFTPPKKDLKGGEI